MTDFVEFDPAAAYRLTHDRLPATSWFALSTRSVDDFIDAGYATGSQNGPRSLALGFGEITGKTYGRKSQSTPAGSGETTTFSQLTWDTGTATDWRSPKSLVLCTSANNKGYAIAAWNLTPGGAATDLSSAHSTVSITPVVSPPSSGGSGSQLRVVTKTADYTAADGDCVLVDATSGNLTITLPAATLNHAVIVKKIDSSAHTVTIAGTIDGATNLVISTQYAAYSLAADGTDWWVI